MDNTQEPTNTIDQVRHAILSEYAQRFQEAALPLGNIHTTSSILNIPVLEGLEAYTANTVVYVPGEPPCIYADYAFYSRDRVCTVLHDELPCPGMTHGESIKLFMDAIVEADGAAQKVEEVFDEMEQAQ